MISDTSSPWVSLLIVCHNDGSWLPRCLQSIEKQSIFPQIEVIIADNASEDDTVATASRLISAWPNARLIHTGGDFGFCAGTNCAAATARGNYLFVLNPDTWLEEDCVALLYAAAERERVAAVGPTVLNYDDDSVQAWCPNGFDFCGNFILPRVRRAGTAFSVGGFFFIRRDVFVRIGGLDEAFFMYCEELDLAWRIWISGEQARAEPKARIHHRGAVGINPDGGAVPPNRTTTRKRFLANRNRLLVLAKNGHHFLMLLILPNLVLAFLEGIATWCVTRKFHVAKAGSFDAITHFLTMGGHIGKQRRLIAGFRRRGDFWMLRFFRLGFGRWDEVRKILKAGFPQFKS